MKYKIQHWFYETIYKWFLQFPVKYHFLIIRHYIKKHPENHSYLIALINTEEKRYKQDGSK